MAYRCNPCRHTSAPYPIARSEWDMKQNAYFCPDCQHDYTLSTNKYPNHPSPLGNCHCGCKPCCCKPMCSFNPLKPPTHLHPCFPPTPNVPPHHLPHHGPVPPHHHGPVPPHHHGPVPPHHHGPVPPHHHLPDVVPKK